MSFEPGLHRIIHLERRGWVEVITGCMFSGKTEELIRRLKRAVIAGQKVEIFKPKIDNRYSGHEVVSHSEQRIASTSVDFANDILMLADQCDVVGIDEAQFFDDQIVKVANLLANKRKRVIISGLDMDFKARPFEQMADLMAVADYVSKLQAVCVNCGAPANYSHRIVNFDQRVMIGEKEAYEPRCRVCFFKSK